MSAEKLKQMYQERRYILDEVEKLKNDRQFLARFRAVPHTRPS
ncbi:hypothetical protein [Pyrobaculum sp.]